ncbi:jerky protein homolog-like [Hylaeus anthracinus]|uniref:jerky protein homolog-like n=1 Tax=Hylaeus anthracinus TaxID=313031 RepID=UPI0023B88CAA|nr:jerky protein homolog-like [Hylaeus anthracinus]
MASSRKLQQVTYEQRLEIVQKLKEGATLDQLAAEYGLHKRTIQRYRQNAISIRQLSKSSNVLHSKRIRPPVYGDVDTLLYTWLSERRALGNMLTDKLLMEKAMELYEEVGGPLDFKASSGWLKIFKKRHNIHLVDMQGENADTNLLAAEKFQDELRNMLINKDIDEEDVYTIHGTSLLWKALPERTLVHEGEEVKEGKIRKDRVTVAFCANATGTHKLPVLFVHKNANPRALKHCKHNLPVVYKYQKNAWINDDLLNDWYIHHFKPYVRQRQLQQNRVGKVLLLLNNCTGHIISEVAQEDYQFKQLFLPPNTVALIESTNQGILSKCKKLFRHKLLCQVLRHGNEVKQFYVDYDIKDCIDLIAEAWDAITATSIRHSWNKIMRRPFSDNTFQGQDSKAWMSEDFQQFGELIHVNDIMEWISECESEEERMEDENSDMEYNVAEEETDYLFSELTTWAKAQPEFIKLHANVLIDYHNQQ